MVRAWGVRRSVSQARWPPKTKPEALPAGYGATGVQMKHRKLTPAERVIYNYGHFDGERGLAPRSVQFTERQREIYDHAYGKGADLRYRARENVRRHANKIRARRELT